MVLRFIAKGIGDDIGHTAHYFFISAGHPALAACGRSGESLNGLIDTNGYVAGSGRIVMRDITDDASKIIVGVF